VRIKPPGWIPKPFVALSSLGADGEIGVPPSERNVFYWVEPVRPPGRIAKAAPVLFEPDKFVFGPFRPFLSKNAER
jgi:hypothetical protein